MEKNSPIRSVSRSLSVLRAINLHGSLSMTAIARHGSLPYPTAFRIVQTLLHEGLIEQEPARKRYRPTALVQSLAHGYQSQSRMINAAERPIRDLTRQIGWPIAFSVRVGPHMVVRDATHCETSLTFGSCDPGVTLPLLTSATGQVALSNQTRSELEETIHWMSLVDPEQAERADLDTLFNRLQHIRGNGFASKACDNGLAHKSASIAVPVVLNERVEAVLTLVYFATAMKQTTAIERYLIELKRTADAVGRNLAGATAREG